MVIELKKIIRLEIKNLLKIKTKRQSARLFLLLNLLKDIDLFYK